MTRATVIVARSTNQIANSGGTIYGIKTPSGVRYLVFIDEANDVVFKKSLDGGLSWSMGVVVFAGTTQNLSVWYDRWSNISAGLIHVAYTENVTHTTRYRTIDTESSDALSTETTMFTGASAAAAGGLSIARARGGNVYCWTMIDAGVEGGFFRLPNANVPNGAWDAARTINEALATTDQMILQPGWNADNQDMMAFFWDASANEVSVQRYDDSANTWAETSIATSMTDIVATVSYPHWAAAVDIANSRNLLAAWSAVDTANADLRCWHVTDTTTTEVTNVVLNSVDDQALCAIGIDTENNRWYVFYAGKSDGSETWASPIKVYYKMSDDAGTTWGPETVISGSEFFFLRWLVCTPRFTGPFTCTWYDTALVLIYTTAQIPIQTRASHQLYGG